MLRDGWASLMAQPVKNLPAMRETWVRCLGQEDPMEKEMANRLVSSVQSLSHVQLFATS